MGFEATHSGLGLRGSRLVITSQSLKLPLIYQMPGFTRIVAALASGGQCCPQIAPKIGIVGRSPAGQVEGQADRVAFREERADPAGVLAAGDLIRRAGGLGVDRHGPHEATVEVDIEDDLGGRGFGRHVRIRPVKSVLA